MNILGIDPGTRRVGYGWITKESGQLKLKEVGLLPITAKTDPEALVEIKQSLDKLLAKISPDIVAVETLFFSKNQKTAMSVAEARGVILLACAEYQDKNQPQMLREFTPNEVKSVCTGNGNADKIAVAKMVKLMLKTPDLKVIDDATDALAIAICAAQKEKFR
jgi:crossover junction endodeoxyribonuclease RuvC